MTLRGVQEDPPRVERSLQDLGQLHRAVDEGDPVRGPPRRRLQVVAVDAGHDPVGEFRPHLLDGHAGPESRHHLGLRGREQLDDPVQVVLGADASQQPRQLLVKAEPDQVLRRDATQDRPVRRRGQRLVQLVDAGLVAHLEDADRLVDPELPAHRERVRVVMGLHVIEQVLAPAQRQDDAAVEVVDPDRAHVGVPGAGELLQMQTGVRVLGELHDGGVDGSTHGRLQPDIALEERDVDAQLGHARAPPHRTVVGCRQLAVAAAPRARAFGRAERSWGWYT